MSNKFTLPEYNQVKNMSLCVIAFKNRKPVYHYGNLSYKQALDKVFERQKEGEICLVIPFVNEQMSGIKGFELRPYNEEEDLDYYLKCLQVKEKEVDEVLDLTLKTFRVHEYGEAKAEGRTTIVKAHNEEEAIKKAPFQEWGATAIEIGICSRCKEELKDPDQTLCNKCDDQLNAEESYNGR